MPMPMPMQSTQNPSLPDDLLLSCFARVSRLNYPTLSLVSKRFRSLLASPEIYKARSLLGHTETCLYVFFESYPRSHWYTLCLKPNRTLTSDTGEMKKKKSSGYVLATVPIPSSPNVRFPGLVAVGYYIYGIEESSYFAKKEECSSHVWILVPKLPCGAPIRLADYGGKMTVFWEGKIENDPYDLRHGGCGYKKIWYAEIALERRKIGREISGKVEWFDHVLTVPKLCNLVKVLAVTVS